MLTHKAVGSRCSPDPACWQSRRQPLPPTLARHGAYLLQRQLPEQRQRAGEQPDEEGRWRAHDVDHGGRQHRDVGVLPGEGVDGRHHRVAARGQGAAAGERGRRAASGGWAASTKTPERRVHTPALSPPPAAENPDSESLLARGCSLVKRLWIGTHVLSAKCEHLGVVGGRQGGPSVFRCSRPLQMARLCKSEIHMLLAQNSKHRKITTLRDRLGPLFKQDDHSVALYWRRPGLTIVWDPQGFGPCLRLCSVCGMNGWITREHRFYTISAELQLPRC